MLKIIDKMVSSLNDLTEAHAQDSPDKEVLSSKIDNFLAGVSLLKSSLAGMPRPIGPNVELALRYVHDEVYSFKSDWHAERLEGALRVANEVQELFQSIERRSRA